MPEPDLLRNALKPGYWEWDMTDDLPFNNYSLMKHLGYPDQELSAKPFWPGKIPVEYQRSFRYQVSKHIKSHGQSPFACEVCFLHNKQKNQYYLFTGRVNRWDLSGHAVEMAGSFVNTTRQHDTEQELAQLKDFMAKVNQAGKIGGWEINIATQHVTWTSGTWDIFGLPASFVPKKDNFIRFFKEGDGRKKLEKAFEQAVVKGEPYDLELKVINAHGEEIWTRTIGYPEFELGACKRVYGIFQDITRQKLDEEKLRMKQVQLEAFIRAAPVAIAMLDRDLNYLATSRIWMASYNIDVESLIGQNHLKVFHEISDEWKGFLQRCLQGETFGKEEDMFYRRDGKQEWLRWELRPWYDEPGRVGGVILFTELITEKKRNQAELIKAKEDAINALQAKSRFMSVMSHEIRTPMNAVIGFTNLLLQDPRADQLEYLKLLKFSGDNLLVIINDILNLSKIEEGMVALESVDVDLKELLQNICALNQPVVKEKQLALSLGFDDALPAFVKGDPVRLGQVLSNLLNNAVKFTARGSVALNARLIRDEKDSVLVYFEIRDTGIGIPEDKQEYVFEVFTQASSETTRKYGGMGLGLAICRKLVALMGGDIQINSRPGEGSVFYFTIDLKKGSAPVDKGRSLNKNNALGSLKGVKLLFAEDNPVNVLLVKRYLQQWQIEYDVAENGLMALHLSQTKHYNVILMDLQMPVMDGYEATKQLRADKQNKNNSTPIIALTASLIGNVLQIVMECGMDDYVGKPFDPTELYERIKINSERLHR